MVNQAETPENTQPAVDAPIDNSVGTTTDITEEFAGVNTFEDTPTPAVDEPTTEDTDTAEQVESSPTATTESEAISPASDSDTPVPAVDTPPVVNPDMDNLQQRMREIEQQNLEYRQMQQQTQLQGQTDQYRQRLEEAGYLPDQASQMSQVWAAEQSRSVQAQQQNEQQIKFVQGQANAAEHFATKYSLEMSDLAQLRQYQDPQSMEAAAKGMKSQRDDKAEIARLRAQLVPSQTFDDSQSTPAASTDEDRWLERYSQGDRSAQANAAARRAAGLG